MKIVILTKDYLDQDNSAFNYDARRLIRRFVKERIEISLLSPYDMKGKPSYTTTTSSKSVATTASSLPIRHFTSITNKSWATSIALTCRASAVYYKDGFDVIQANDFAALIAGVHLKWSFRTPLIFLADEDEFAMIEEMDTKTKEGIEEVMRFCLAYVDYVIVWDNMLFDRFRRSFRFPVEKIMMAGKDNRKILQVYNRIVMKR